MYTLSAARNDSGSLEEDGLCDIYFALTGRDRMTNYFHLIHAGHYLYFLLKYRNMYWYPQQGWENINGRIKKIFHDNTQKGGSQGGSSKLVPSFRTNY